MTSGRPIQRVEQQLARHQHRKSDQGLLEETKTKHAYVDSTAKMLAQSSIDTATLQAMFASESVYVTDS